jgi:hypothetical protein
LKKKKEGITNTCFSKDLFDVSVKCLARDGKNNTKMTEVASKNRKTDSERKLKKL